MCHGSGVWQSVASRTVLSKWLKGSTQLSAHTLPSASATIRRNGIRMSPKISVALHLCGTLTHTRNLADFLLLSSRHIDRLDRRTERPPLLTTRRMRCTALHGLSTTTKTCISWSGTHSSSLGWRHLQEKEISDSVLAAEATKAEIRY